MSGSGENNTNMTERKIYLASYTTDIAAATNSHDECDEQRVRLRSDSAGVNICSPCRQVPAVCDEHSDDPCGTDATRNGAVLSPMACETSDEPSSLADALQDRYKRKVELFFANIDNYRRLEKFVLHRHQKIFLVLQYFIIRYKPRCVYPCQPTYDNGPKINALGNPVYLFYRPKNEYTRALKKYKKKYFNFEDKVGAGNLVWNNLTNPKFLVSPENGNISLTLPKVNALYWTIQYGFDVVFWDNYDTINTSYEEYTAMTKRRYTEAHKKKKQIIRREMEALVIAERDRKIQEDQTHSDDGGGTDDTGTVTRRKRRRPNEEGGSSRRKTRLCRELRRKVTTLIQDRKNKIRAQASEKTQAERKRRRPPADKAKQQTILHLNPPTISF